MNIKEKIQNCFAIFNNPGATIAIGLGCIVVGVVMIYQETKVTINQISISAGLILIILGLILIVINRDRSDKNINLNPKEGRGLITILIAGGIALLFGYLLWGLSKSNVSQYDIFRDLLTIILAILALLSVGSFYLIRHFVLEEVRKEIKSAEHRVWASYKTELGELNYFLAETLTMMPLDWKNQMKERAVELTSKALMKEIEISPTVRKHNLLVAKNNIAYYWASIHEQQEGNRWDLKKRAEEYAEEVRLQYKKGDRLFGNPEFLETYAFVKARFAQTDNEKDEARKLITSFLLNPELEKKKKNLEKSLEWLEREKK